MAERARCRAWDKANPDAVRARYKRWYAKNGKPQPKRTPQRVIEMNLRRRVWSALKKQSGRKATKTDESLGCSVKSFMLYLESRFDVGMSWENYGKWEIDHILPCALFDLTKPEHQKRCFHFSNLQPLWKPDNRSKGAKLFHEPGFLQLSGARNR